MKFNKIYEDIFKPENINKQNRYGETALWYATNWGYKDIVKLLLDNGADVNVTDKGSHSALDYAINRNFQDIVNLLKQYGAKL